MNKLARKFMLGIIIVFSVTTIATVIINTQLATPFYLAQKRQALSKISSQFVTLLQQTGPQTAIAQIEAEHKVIIAQIDSLPEADNNEVNAQIQAAFQAKGVGFQKYWFWEDDYQRVLAGENQLKLYAQPQLNYSLLIEYVKVETSIYAITLIVPNVNDAFQIANTLFIASTIGSLVLALLVIAFLVKKITNPLATFVQFAKQLRAQHYEPLDIQTHDELESVAASLNEMGSQVVAVQHALTQKNAAMEQLLADVAHELKTPIALIQLYATGIEDGLDDGTFLTTIIAENKQLATMVERLLHLVSLEQSDAPRTRLDLSHLIVQLVQKYEPLARVKDREFVMHAIPPVYIQANEALLESLITNLLSNAIKYATTPAITLDVSVEADSAKLTIRNSVEPTTIDLEKMWQPYYVGEQSRNKALSGTGLGLSIVKKICETQHYVISGTLNDDQFQIQVQFPLDHSE